MKHEKHPDYDAQQKRLPEGCILWGNYGDGLWRVMPPGPTHRVTLGFATPTEAVDAFMKTKIGNVNHAE